MRHTCGGDDLLLHPEGGSLNRIAIDGDAVIKSYDGPIPRGHQKLRREYYLLSELPDSAARHFARPISYYHRTCPPWTELRLRREDKVAVAKGILRGLWPARRTGEIVACALRLAVGELYPIRRTVISGREAWHRFHRPRLTSALAALRCLPDIANMVDARHLIVNGKVCPPFAVTASFLEDNAARYFKACNVVAAHGDLHLDNILSTSSGRVEITFVDPRGEDAPPHYDFGKMYKATTAAYDPIHYGKYALRTCLEDTSVRIELLVDDAFQDHYLAAHQSLLTALPAFADAEGLSADDFRRAVVVASYVHVVSFSWYHANHPSGRDSQRITAFLATAALMAQRIVEAGPARRISLADPASPL